MRNQVHKQRQNITHNSINHNNYLDSPSQNTASKQKHKSICFIQITDIAQNHHIDQNKCFRNTFFGKLGKKVSPKKNFFNTIMDKLKQNSNYESMVAKKTERKMKEGFIQKDYAQRSSFVIKQLSPVHQHQFKIGINDLGKQQKNVQTQDLTTANIIEDIEKLRFTQSGYMELKKQRQQQLHTHSYNEDEIHNQYKEFYSHPQSKLSKEDIILSLRQKIKNKQSKKHIYHTLKSKNQAWNKIRIKTHPHFTNQSRNTQSQVSYQIESVRLHCKQPKNFIKHAYSKNSKPLNSTIEYINPLKVQSRPCMLSFNVYDPPSLIPFSKQSNWKTVQSPQSLSNKLKTKRQLYQQIITSVKSTNKNGSSQRSRTGNNSIQNNQFRDLTPWKNDYDDLL